MDEKRDPALDDTSRDPALDDVAQLLREREDFERRRFEEMIQLDRQMRDTRARVKRALGLDDDWQPRPPA